jgi:hydrogenase nickel incorporation protein HypB
MPAPAVFRVSAKTGEGIDRWSAWLEERRPVQTTEMAGFDPHPHSHHHHHAVPRSA